MNALASITYAGYIDALPIFSKDYEFIEALKKDLRLENGDPKSVLSGLEKIVSPEKPANMLYNGLSLQFHANNSWKKETKGFKLILEAAILGFMPAEYAVGCCFELGQGIALDIKQAIYWLSCAADHGSIAAKANLAYYYNRGIGCDMDKVKAHQLYEEAAQGGHARVQYIVGCRYLKGEGVAADPRKAQYWLTKAAEQGEADALFNLGVMLLLGEGGITKDFDRGLANIRRAADLGQKNAVEFLAKLDAEVHDKTNPAA